MVVNVSIEVIGTVDNTVTDIGALGNLHVNVNVNECKFRIPRRKERMCELYTSVWIVPFQSCLYQAYFNINLQPTNRSSKLFLRLMFFN